MLIQCLIQDCLSSGTTLTALPNIGTTHHQSVTLNNKSEVVLGAEVDPEMKIPDIAVTFMGIKDLQRCV